MSSSSQIAYNTPPTTPSTNFRISQRAVLLTWSALKEEPTMGLVARYEAFCRSRPNHWQTLAVVERHDPKSPSFNPERPLHVHAPTISEGREGGWNTRNTRFQDFEGNHPNIVGKDLKEGPGGTPAMTAFHYLWKAVGELGEEVEDLMAGELTEESLTEILVKGKGRKGGKWTRMQADLEDSEEIIRVESQEEYYRAYKRLRPLQLSTAWNSIRAYAEFTYKEDTGLLEPIPVVLDQSMDCDHIKRAESWLESEVPEKARGM